MKKGEYRTLVLIIFGILVYFLIASVPVLIFTHRKLQCETGLLIGSVLAVFMAWHMNFTIARSVYLEKNHSFYLAGNSVLRLVIVAGLIVLAVRTGVADPVFSVVGLFGLKVGAYLEPILEKRK